MLKLIIYTLLTCAHKRSTKHTQANTRRIHITVQTTYRTNNCNTVIPIYTGFHIDEIMNGFEPTH